MKKCFFIVMILLLLMPFILFAQGGGEKASEKNNEITLRFMWWGGDSRHEATLKAIELYEKRNPGVKIIAEYGGIEGYQQKLFTQLAGGNAPDIIQVDAWWTDAQNKFHCFADLSNFANLDISGFDRQFIIDYGTIDGIIYALPTGINSPMMIINRDVLEDAGIEWRDQWTWEDILVEGPKVHQQNPNRYFLNVDQYTATYYIQRAYLSQLSGNPTTLDDVYKLGFSKEELVQVYSYIMQCYELGIMQPPEDSLTYKEKSEQNPLWINGNAAVSLNWTSKYADLKGNLKNLDVAVLPIMESGAKNTGMFNRPSQLICINDSSKYKEACASFLDFFYNDPEAQQILKDVRSVPAVESARNLCNEQNLMDPMIVKATDNALKNPGVVDSVLSQDVVCLDLLYNEYENLVFGKETPEQAADTLMNGWKSRLAELEKNK